MPETRTRRDARWSFPLLLLVIGAHAWLGWKLALYRPAGVPPGRFANPGSTASELLMVLDFTSRASASKASRRAVRDRQSRRGYPGKAGGPASDASAGDIDGVDSAPSAALDLELRPQAQPSFGALDPLRERRGLEFESTRFDHAWISEGDLEHVAARRSKVAATILGVLGALRKPCTDHERREHDPACVPDQYHYPDAVDAAREAR